MGDQTDPISRLLQSLLGNPLRDLGGNVGSTYTTHRTFGTSWKELDVPQPYDNKERAEAWKFCAEVVEDHSEALLKQWNAELDMQLVFAGLFSTALTAFNVESYSLLQPDKGDIVVAALALMSAQLHHLSVGQNSATSTVISFVPPSASAFMAPRYAIWLNALWFSSLVCTLSASFIAVMIKQWLHQYTKGISGVSREAARLRQHRYESLHQWRVPQILMVLPILLQVSLFLFLAGVVILLWNIHPIVATCASSLFGLLLLFTVITTILPAFRMDCCYLSPQAMGIFTYSQLIGRFLVSSLSSVAARLSAICEAGSRDVSRMKRCCRRMLRLLTKAIRQLGRWSSWPSWEIRERMAVESRVQYLDRSLAATTYAVTLDDDVLNAELSRCMWDMDADNLVPFCRDVLSAPGIDHDRRGTPLDTFLLNYCISAMSKANEYQLRSSADRETLMDYPIWFSTQSLEERGPSDMLDGLPDHHSAYLWGLPRMAPQHTSAFFRLAEILKAMPKSSGMDVRTIRKVNEILPIGTEHMRSLMDDLTRNRHVDTASHFLGLLAFFISCCTAASTGELDSFHILKRTFASMNLFFHHHATPAHQARVLNGLYHSRLIPLLVDLVEKPSCNLRSFCSLENNPLHTLAKALENIQAHCRFADNTRTTFYELVGRLETICTRPSPLVDSLLCERVRHLALDNSAEISIGMVSSSSSRFDGSRTKAFNDYIQRNNLTERISWSSPALKTGPDGAQSWSTSIFLGTVEYGRGAATTTSAAREMAAEMALRALWSENGFWQRV